MEELPTPYPKVLGSNQGFLLLRINLTLSIRRLKSKLEHMISKKELAQRKGSRNHTQRYWVRIKGVLLLKQI